MDFSSIPRVLDSLVGRQPPCDAEIVQRAQELAAGSAGADVWLSALEEWLSSSSERWEPLAVGLYIATELVQHQQQPSRQADDAKKQEDTRTNQQAVVYMEGPRVPSMQPNSSPETTIVLPTLSQEQAWKLCQLLHAMTLKHLEHKEPRVRTLVAKAVAAHVQWSLRSSTSSHNLRRELHERLITSIHQHIAAGRDADGDYSRSSTGALDDTTGWRALETNWQCLAALISSMGPQFFVEFPLSDELLQDVQFSCITHVNRHVRAAAMAVLEQCILAAPETQLMEASPLRQTILAVLKTGLADNWSQVRMAASVLCRVFLMRLPKDWWSDTSMAAVLLPRMCSNRFYLAQGVKLYSHETWKSVFPDSGLPAVAQQLPAVVRYYVKMCDADNHVVREAACQAIAELSVRLGDDDEYHDQLQPHVPTLLQALLMCFHDESWPVRDEACLACGILCKSFPQECQPEFETLWERWTEQLTDQIWSLREDAAVALGDALDAYGLQVWETMSTQLIPKILRAAREQPAMTQEEYKAHVNDPAGHTDSVLYSCGSLAPKLSKRKEGAGRIGCSNCGIDCPKAPWEATDGCIYLLRELCLRCNQYSFLGQDERDDSVLLPLLTELADVCRVRHFLQAGDLRATLWRQLPVMAQALGKQRFKRVYLPVFMDLLFDNLEWQSASQLSLHAAGQCVEALADLIGHAMFRGQLDEMQQKTFDRVIRERRHAPLDSQASSESSGWLTQPQSRASTESSGWLTQPQSEPTSRPAATATLVPDSILSDCVQELCSPLTECPSPDQATLALEKTTPISAGTPIYDGDVESVNTPAQIPVNPTGGSRGRPHEPEADRAARDAEGQSLKRDDTADDCGSGGTQDPTADLDTVGGNNPTDTESECASPDRATLAWIYDGDVESTECTEGQAGPGKSGEGGDPLSSPPAAHVGTPEENSATLHGETEVPFDESPPTVQAGRGPGQMKTVADEDVTFSAVAQTDVPVDATEQIGARQSQEIRATSRNDANERASARQSEEILATSQNDRGETQKALEQANVDRDGDGGGAVEALAADENDTFSAVAETDVSDDLESLQGSGSESSHLESVESSEHDDKGRDDEYFPSDSDENM